MIALQDAKEMGFLEKERIRKGSFRRRFGMSLLECCNYVRLPKVFDFLCSCDPYSILLDFWKDTPFTTHFPWLPQKGSLWDISKVTVYFEAGFKYWPEIGGIVSTYDLVLSQSKIKGMTSLENSSCFGEPIL